MGYNDIRQFMRHLEQRQLLRRVAAAVSPVLEIPEITRRMTGEDGRLCCLSRFGVPADRCLRALWQPGTDAAGSGNRPPDRSTRAAISARVDLSGGL